MSRTDSAPVELPARPDGLDPGEVARHLAGALERLNDPVRPDDLDALRVEIDRLTAAREQRLHNPS